MTLQVKVLLNLRIDEDEYTVPVDGKIDEELEDAFTEYFHEINGMSIRHIKIITTEN